MLVKENHVRDQATWNGVATENIGYKTGIKKKEEETGMSDWQWSKKHLRLNTSGQTFISGRQILLLTRRRLGYWYNCMLLHVCKPKTKSTLLPSILTCSA